MNWQIFHYLFMVDSSLENEQYHVQNIKLNLRSIKFLALFYVKTFKFLNVLYKRHEVCYKSMLVFLFLWRWSTNINDYKTLVSIFQTLGHLHTWFFSTLTKIHVLHISGKLPNLNVLCSVCFFMEMTYKCILNDNKNLIFFRQNLV